MLLLFLKDFKKKKSLLLVVNTIEENHWDVLVLVRLDSDANFREGTNPPVQIGDLYSCRNIFFIFNS